MSILAEKEIWSARAAAAKSLQPCPTLCDPIDGSPPGSPVPGILQARTLEWVAISFSDEGKWKMKVKSLSCVRLLATPRAVAYQAPPSMGFSRQEYWSGVPLPSPEAHVHLSLTKYSSASPHSFLKEAFPLHTKHIWPRNLYPPVSKALLAFLSIHPVSKVNFFCLSKPVFSL